MPRTYLGHVLPQTLAEKARPESTALLVIDMQNDFVHDDGHCARSFGVEKVRGFQSIVPALKELTTAARAAGVPVIHTRVSQLPDGSLASPVWLADALRRGYEPLHCMRGTWGWEFIDELAPQPGDIVVEKTRRSAFVGTNLDNLLRVRGVRTVVAAGIAGSGCVNSTVRDAIERDYFAIVPADCVADNTAELTEVCLRAFGALMAPEDLPTYAELAAVWAASVPAMRPNTSASSSPPA